VARVRDEAETVYADLLATRGGRELQVHARQITLRATAPRRAAATAPTRQRSHRALVPIAHWPRALWRGQDQERRARGVRPHRYGVILVSGAGANGRRHPQRRARPSMPRCRVAHSAIASASPASTRGKSSSSSSGWSLSRHAGRHSCGRQLPPAPDRLPTGFVCRVCSRTLLARRRRCGLRRKGLKKAPAHLQPNGPCA
jgi:hypothetical protein